MILTVSRMDAEKSANPGYRAFLANGFNVTRELVLFTWEVLLEYSAALRQRRRGVIPRGHRGGRYPYLRAALCVVVRDLIVYGVLTDMMRGRPAVYATFSSYDEVAHHSGLERADTLEALRKLDLHFGRIERARRLAPRPYKIVVLSDHGQTQGMTFKQRNGYGLEELVERSLAHGSVAGMGGGDEHDAAVGQALQEATGGCASTNGGTSVGDKHAIVLGSGNLGLVYLMEEKRRLTAEEIEQRHPRLLPALAEHPHIGFLLVHSAEHGPLAMNARRRQLSGAGTRRGRGPAGRRSRATPRAICCARTDSSTSPDIMVGSFYDPALEEGCAFEELISFHGGLGGPQTRPFLLYPVDLPAPEGPIVGAAHVHEILSGWRRLLQGEPAQEPAGATRWCLRGGDALEKLRGARHRADRARRVAVPDRSARRRGILHVRRRVPAPDSRARRAHGDPRLDAHRDHLDPTAEPLAGGCPVIVPRGCAAVRGAAAAGGDRLDEGDASSSGMRPSEPCPRSGWPPLSLRAPAAVARVPAERAQTDLLRGRHRPVHGYVRSCQGWWTSRCSRSGAGAPACPRDTSPGPRGRGRGADPAAAAVPIHWGTLRSWGAQRGLIQSLRHEPSRPL